MDYIKPNLTLRDFQKDAIAFLTSRNKSMCALPTGTGKTIVSFSSYAKHKAKNPNLKLIYITEKPLIRQTISQDLPKYFNFSFTYIYNNTKQERVERYKAWLKLHDVIVLNYSSLRIDFDVLGQVFSKVEGLELMVVYDEATNFKNPNAQITDCVKKLSKVAKFVIALTATPASRGLADIFNLMLTLGIAPYQNIIVFNKLHAVMSAKKMFLFKCGDRKVMAIGKPMEKEDAQICYVNFKKSFKLEGSVKIMTRPTTGIFTILDENKGTISWALYNEIYTRATILLLNGTQKLSVVASVFNEVQHTGYKNLKLFRERTKDRLFVRAKREIVKELPPVTVSVRYCDEDEQSIKAVKEVYKTDKYSASQIEIAQLTPQAVLEIDPYYKTDKIQRVVDFIKNDLQTEKVIIYFPFTTATDALKLILEEELGQEVAYCYGGNKDNNAELTKFLNTKEIQVLIGTNTILKGLNIQAVNHIITLQPPYTAEQYIQLIGRVNRIGGDYSPKFITHFVCENTRDVDIMQSLNGQLTHIAKINPKFVEDGLLPQTEAQDMTEEQAKAFLDNQLETRKTMYL